MKCLVTTLKESVANDTLKKRGEYVIEVDSAYGTIYNVLEGCIFDARVTGDVTITKKKSGETTFNNVGTSASFKKDEVMGILANGVGKVFIKPKAVDYVSRINSYENVGLKYNIKYMFLNYTEIGTLTLSSKKTDIDTGYLPKITNIIELNNITGKLSDVANESIKSIKINTSDNFSGDIGSLASYTNITKLHFANCANITGSLKALCDGLLAAGKRTDLTVTTWGTQITGLGGTSDTTAYDQKTINFTDSGWSLAE